MATRCWLSDLRRHVPPRLRFVLPAKCLCPRVWGQEDSLQVDVSCLRDINGSRPFGLPTRLRGLWLSSWACYPTPPRAVTCPPPGSPGAMVTAGSRSLLDRGHLPAKLASRTEAHSRIDRCWALSMSLVSPACGQAMAPRVNHETPPPRSHGSDQTAQQSPRPSRCSSRRLAEWLSDRVAET